MRILSAKVENFGSYGDLEFDFDGQGLTLIAGPTGSGKSTLFDIIPWVLFGITAKNGAADDVRSWHGGETRGDVTVELPNGSHVGVRRVRGKTNDLVFTQGAAQTITRGKDLNDTQRLLNQVLGLTPELYLAGAYFHEFSQTASFFTAAAKVRRAITEQLVDLTLAKKLTERLAAHKKEVKANLAETEQLLSTTRYGLSMKKDQVATAAKNAIAWTKMQDEKIAKCEASMKSFEDDKVRRVEGLHNDSLEWAEKSFVAIARYHDDIKQLEAEIQDERKVLKQQEELKTRRAGLTDEVCSACGAKKDSHHRLQMMQEEATIKTRLMEISNAKRGLATAKTMLAAEQKKENPFGKLIDAELDRTNTYAEMLEALKAEVNPHHGTIDRVKHEVTEIESDLEAIQAIVDDLKTQLADLDTLGDIVDQFRGALVKRAIKDLENKTNDLLTKHFDAELRVEFDIASADKLEVSITKDGNSCSYAQLSKGQRQLLKLCFGVSVMKVVAQHHAVQFSTIFLDEFADGCDEEKKAQAFGLLQNLATEYSSVFAIDHSEGLKAMFEKRIDVRLEDGRSILEQS